jgi:hypothetical protein
MAVCVPCPAQSLWIVQLQPTHLLTQAPLHGLHLKRLSMPQPANMQGLWTAPREPERPPEPLAQSITACSVSDTSAKLAIRQTAGLVDCILESLNDHPDPSLKRSILESVLICGGGACTPGLGDRVLQVGLQRGPNTG